jgi:hypothetical protein
VIQNKMTQEDYLVRPEVVAELEEVIKRYPKSSKEANLRTAVAHRTTPELGVSSAEIAKAFYPEIFEKSMYHAYRHTHALVSKVRKSLSEMGLAFEYAMISVPGRGEQRLYYCMHGTDPNILNMYARGQRRIDRIYESIGRTRHIFRNWQKPAERERVHQERMKESLLDTTILGILANTRHDELNNVKRLSTLLNVESKVIISRLHGLRELVEGRKITSSRTLCYSLTEKGRLYREKYGEAGKDAAHRSAFSG